MSTPTEPSTPTAEPEKWKRPIPLTIFCCLGFLGFPLMLSQASNPFLKIREIAIHGEAHYQWFFILLVAMMIGYVGLWFMRRYGLFIFLASAVAFGVHNYIGVQNALAFKAQVLAEDTGEPWTGRKRDTSFLDDPEYKKYIRTQLREANREKAIRDTRQAIIQQPSSSLWIRFVINALQSVFVAFVALLSFRRLR